MTFIIHSPLDQFEVVSLTTITAPVIGDFVVAITNLGLYTIITLILVINIHFVADNSYRIIPSRWSVALESAYATVLGIVRDQIGAKYEVYFPFVYTIFMWLLFANINGNVPYGFTVTTSVIVAIGLSVMIFIAVTILGLSKHRLHFFAYFLPEGTPIFLVPMLSVIEIISYLSRALSLGVRLFANIVAGHTLLKILSTFLVKLFSAGTVTATLTLIPFVIFVALISLEIAVSFIQAYVFVVLVSSYIKDAEILH